MSATAIFLWGGMRDCFGGDIPADFYEKLAGGGMVEAAGFVASIADDIDKAVHLPDDLPGVWEYEVAELVGTFIAGAGYEGDLTHRVAVDYAVQITKEWLERG